MEETQQGGVDLGNRDFIDVAIENMISVVADKKYLSHKLEKAEKELDEIKKMPEENRIPTEINIKDTAATNIKAETFFGDMFEIAKKDTNHSYKLIDDIKSNKSTLSNISNWWDKRRQTENEFTEDKTNGNAINWLRRRWTKNQKEYDATVDKLKNKIDALNPNNVDPFLGTVVVKQPNRSLYNGYTSDLNPINIFTIDNYIITGDTGDKQKENLLNELVKESKLVHIPINPRFKLKDEIESEIKRNTPTITFTNFQKELILENIKLRLNPDNYEYNNKINFEQELNKLKQELNDLEQNQNSTANKKENDIKDNSLALNRISFFINLYSGTVHTYHEVIERSYDLSALNTTDKIAQHCITKLNTESSLFEPAKNKLVSIINPQKGEEITDISIDAFYTFAKDARYRSINTALLNALAFVKRDPIDYNKQKQGYDDFTRTYATSDVLTSPFKLVLGIVILVAFSAVSTAGATRTAYIAAKKKLYENERFSVRISQIGDRVQFNSNTDTDNNKLIRQLANSKGSLLDEEETYSNKIDVSEKEAIELYQQLWNFFKKERDSKLQTNLESDTPVTNLSTAFASNAKTELYTTELTRLTTDPEINIIDTSGKVLEAVTVDISGLPPSSATATASSIKNTEIDASQLLGVFFVLFVLLHKMNPVIRKIEDKLMRYRGDAAALARELPQSGGGEGEVNTKLIEERMNAEMAAFAQMIPTAKTDILNKIFALKKKRDGFTAPTEPQLKELATDRDSIIRRINNVQSTVIKMREILEDMLNLDVMSIAKDDPEYKKLINDDTLHNLKMYRATVSALSNVRQITYIATFAELLKRFRAEIAKESRILDETFQYIKTNSKQLGVAIDMEPKGLPAVPKTASDADAAAHTSFGEKIKARMGMGGPAGNMYDNGPSGVEESSGKLFNIDPYILPICIVCLYIFLLVLFYSYLQNYIKDIQYKRDVYTQNTQNLPMEISKLVSRQQDIITLKQTDTGLTSIDQTDALLISMLYNAPTPAWSAYNANLGNIQKNGSTYTLKQAVSDYMTANAYPMDTTSTLDPPNRIQTNFDKSTKSVSHGFALAMLKQKFMLTDAYTLTNPDYSNKAWNNDYTTQILVAAGFTFSSLEWIVPDSLKNISGVATLLRSSTDKFKKLQQFSIAVLLTSLGYTCTNTDNYSTMANFVKSIDPVMYTLLVKSELIKDGIISDKTIQEVITKTENNPTYKSVTEYINSNIPAALDVATTAQDLVKSIVNGSTQRDAYYTWSKVGDTSNTVISQRSLLIYLYSSLFKSVEGGDYKLKISTILTNNGYSPPKSGTTSWTGPDSKTYDSDQLALTSLITMNCSTITPKCPINNPYNELIVSGVYLFDVIQTEASASALAAKNLLELFNIAQQADDKAKADLKNIDSKSSTKIADTDKANTQIVRTTNALKLAKTALDDGNRIAETAKQRALQHPGTRLYTSSADIVAAPNLFPTLHLQTTIIDSLMPSRGTLAEAKDALYKQYIVVMQAYRACHLLQVTPTTVPFPWTDIIISGVVLLICIFALGFTFYNFNPYNTAANIVKCRECIDKLKNYQGEDNPYLLTCGDYAAGEQKNHSVGLEMVKVSFVMAVLVATFYLSGMVLGSSFTYGDTLFAFSADPATAPCLK